MTQVRAVRLRRIYDSRGKETVEATVRLADGSEGVAGAPSGASTGTHEAQAFPTGGVAHVLDDLTAPIVRQLTAPGDLDQAAFDARLHTVDGTPTFARIGGNTATALSLAFAFAESTSRGMRWVERIRRPETLGKFPAIVGNCLNGGKHAIGGPDVQEFHAFSPSPDPLVAVPAALAVHRLVGEAIHAKWPKLALGRGDEGGWVAPLGNVEALQILVEACTKVRDELHLPVYPGLDLAASEFYHDHRYVYHEQTVDPEGQRSFLAGLVDRHDLRYLEDPFEQEAFGDFAALTREVGHRTLVVGDDLYTTRVERLQRGIREHASNGILIKVNQVGTVTDTLATVDLARSNGIRTVTSHRSGDLPEGWLAELAVATGAAGLKCGLLGGERVAKLNELLRVAAATGAVE